MTLILTELSSLGIAMAADSAVTSVHKKTGVGYATPNAAEKLQVVPYLKAGISCWGLGSINGVSTDKWLSNFIKANTKCKSLQGFADKLAKQLNTQVSPSNSSDSRLGLHLAAFENHNGTPTPSFYHVHDGQSTSLGERGIYVDPNQFNANHDVPPQMFQQIANNGGAYITRNGDYQMYATIFHFLEKFFEQLKNQMGISIPNSQNLADRSEYLVFQIRTMSDIYRLSNLVPGIGGRIHYLTINPAGIHSQGIRFF